MFYENHAFQVVSICVLTVLAIVIYGTFRCKTPDFVDPLTYSLAPPPWDKFVDGWGILHLFFYMILAYVYPQKWLLIFLLGLAWEILESYFYDHPFYISKCNYQLSTDDVAGWWYGRWQDIVMNSIGIFVGYMLSSKT